jgi:hypothetical protein
MGGCKDVDDEEARALSGKEQGFHVTVGEIDLEPWRKKPLDEMNPLEGLWGIWGGRGLGAWCPFTSCAVELTMPPFNRYTTGHGWAYCGTRWEAEAAAKRLREEYPDTSYEVAPFDPDREPRPPVSALRIPTKAQRAALEHVRDVGEWPYGLNCPRRSTMEACFARGWIQCLPLKAPHLRITRAGKEALEKSAVGSGL